MTMSRALDPLDAAVGADVPAKALAAAGARPVGIGQPMAPVFTAIAVMVLVVQIGRAHV